ncbi:MAG: hypothetical protein V2G42_05880 [bacterium JZ-2024 1]
MNRVVCTLAGCAVVLSAISATSSALPRISLSGRGECRFSLASESGPAQDPRLSSFECIGRYTVVTGQQEIQAPRLAFDGVRLTASGGASWKDESTGRTITGESMEYHLEAQSVTVSGSVRALASGYSSESEELRYDHSSGVLTLTGSVLMTRTSDTLSAQSVRISGDGSLIAETGVFLRRDPWELKCNRLERNPEITRAIGDLFIRAMVANSEIAFTASEGSLSSDATSFRLVSVTAAFPRGDLRSDTVELELPTKTLKATGKVMGIVDGRRFTADSAIIQLDDTRITLSGKVSIWIPREEFRRKIS